MRIKGKNSPKGMTIIEVMFALVIIVSVMFVVIRLFVQGTYGLKHSKFRTIAIFLAQQKMEEVIYAPASMILPESGRFDGDFGDYSYNVTFSEYQKKLREVTVEVKDPTGRTVDLRCLKQANTGHMVFWSDKDGNPQIYLMSADGGGVRRLTKDDAADRDPALSPDGRRVVYVSDRKDQANGLEDGKNNLFILDIGRKKTRCLTKKATNPGTPAWAPNGRRIAFSAYDKGYSQIFAVDDTGEGLVNLSDNLYHEGSPAWSPDGTRIAFVSNRDGDLDIYSMSACGGDEKRLTDTQGWDVSPSWSSDGKSILFISNRDGNPEIYVMDADGGRQRRITKNSFNESDPVWSPDGDDIAFCSNQGSEKVEIYVMSKEGENLRRLTRDNAVNRYVRWSN